MRLLLDSHALLWVLDDPERLPRAARAMVADPDIPVFVSLVSLWKLRIKVASGKLEAPDDLPRLIDASGFDLLSISVAHIDRIGGLPFHHRDPFDRMLIAQAQAEGLTLVSADRTLSLYDVPVLWS